MNRTSKIALLAMTLTALSACAEAGPEDTLPEGEEVGEAEQAATLVNRFVQNGGSADMWFGDATSWNNVSVYEGGTAQKRQVSLSYWRSTVDPTSWECHTESYDWDGDGTIDDSWEWCDYSRGSWAYGWGEIPSSAAKLSKGGAKLDVALESLTNFYGESCSWDRNDPNGWSCTNGAAASGEIHLTWQKNGEYSSTGNGTWSYNYGEYSYRSTGVSSNTSASVAGTLFGASVEATGGLGWGKNVSIDRIRN